MKIKKRQLRQICKTFSTEGGPAAVATLVLLASLSLFTGCASDTPVAGGTTTETTNGIAARLVLPDEKPAAGLPVTLKKASFLSGRGDTVYRSTTDSTGFFRFRKLPEGIYAVSCVNGDSSLGCFIDSIELGVVPAGMDSVEDSILSLETKALEKTGALCGIIINDSITTGSRIRLRIYGTELDISVPADSIFYLEKLPSHNYRMNISVSGLLSSDRADIHVNSGDTSFAGGLHPADGPSFSGFKRIVFNTASPQTGISGDVTEFPLLIRLDGSNSTGPSIFTLENNPGSVRFLDIRNSTWLPFEIEEWNTQSESAQAWVKVPEIFSGTVSDYLVMLYGADMADGQRPDLVFDPGQGYSAVWHCSSPSGLSLPEATSAQPAGTKKSAGEPLETEGIIGFAQQFDGVDDWIDLGRQRDFVNGSSAFLFSAWIKPESGGGTIIDIGGPADSSQSRIRLGLNVNGSLSFDVNPDDAPEKTHTLGSVSELPFDAWSFVCASADLENGSLSLYINGDTDTSSTEMFDVQSFPETPSFESAMGSSGSLDSGFFHGTIDEAGIFRDTLSLDRIRMMWQTQRTDGEIVNSAD